MFKLLFSSHLHFNYSWHFKWPFWDTSKVDLSKSILVINFWALYLWEAWFLFHEVYASWQDIYVSSVNLLPTIQIWSTLIGCRKSVSLLYSKSHRQLTLEECNFSLKSFCRSEVVFGNPSKSGPAESRMEVRTRTRMNHGKAMLEKTKELKSH